MRKCAANRPRLGPNLALAAARIGPDLGIDLARRSPLGLIRRVNPNYKAGWFHRDLARRLRDFSHAVARGESPRLVLNVPPRHGKTALLCAFCAWHLGDHPEHSVIYASYGQDSAGRASKDVRPILDLADYQAAFPRSLVHKGRDNIGEWETTAGGIFKAVGVGGPLVGRGCNVLVVDDPHKNALEGCSPRHTGKVWDWYGTAAKTRLAPGGGVVVCHQRWSTHDLTGRLLDPQSYEERGEEQVARWERVIYPALAVCDEEHRKAGEPLDADRYPMLALLDWRGSMTPSLWAAVGQQSPNHLSSGVRPESIRWIDASEVPRHLRWIRAWDTATSEKTTADHTAGIKAAFDPDSQRLYLASPWARQLEQPAVLGFIEAVAAQDGPSVEIFIEGVASQISVYQNLRARPAMLPYKITPVSKIQDKVTASVGWRTRAADNLLFCVRGGDWAEFLHQWEHFGTREHDDCVDAVSRAAEALAAADSTDFLGAFARAIRS